MGVSAPPGRALAMGVVSSLIPLREEPRHWFHSPQANEADIASRMTCVAMARGPEVRENDERQRFMMIGLVSLDSRETQTIAPVNVGKLRPTCTLEAESLIEEYSPL